MRTTKQLQRFYVVEVFRTQPLITGSQGSETVSLPYGVSAFDQAQYTTRDHRVSSKGQALQFAYGLDFLSIQAYRLWMEYPSRGKYEENKLAISDRLVGGLRDCAAETRGRYSEQGIQKDRRVRPRLLFEI